MKQSFQLSDLRSMPRIKKAAYQAPVLLTENGSPEFVFMTISEYEKLKKEAKKKPQRPTEAIQLKPD